MEGEDETSIFGEEVNSILREDSVVRSMRPFLNELINSNNPVQQHRQVINEQQQGYVTVLNGVIHQTHQPLNNQNLIDTQPNYYQPRHFEGHHQVRLSAQQMQPSHDSWDAVDYESNSHHGYGEESLDGFRSNLNCQHNSNVHLRHQDQQYQDSSSPFAPNHNSVLQIPPISAPSLQPWNGLYNFNISVTTDNKDKNKWCYNEEMRKLYLCPLIAVPVDVTLQKNCDASVRITPVYSQSHHRMESVTRCFNCKSKGSCDANMAEHIVQIEGEESQYEKIQDRYVVTVPLPPPPPGEESSTLLIKMMCLTSCVGGPNRRPFCLVFTLICNSTGREIGRQVIEVKCCRCPHRDMNNDRSPRSGNVANNRPANIDQKQTDRIREITSQIQVGQKRRKVTKTLDFVPKTEPDTGDAFVDVVVKVPAKYVSQVKRYVNALMAKDILKRSQKHLLLYSESEGDE